jgi:homopolymeric O-antigen transport system permease protein
VVEVAGAVTGGTITAGAAGRRRLRPPGSRTVQVTLHLTGREFRIRYQAAFLGWLWALAPAVARFLVLGLVFSALFAGAGPDYLAELAVGVLAWNWFSAGVAASGTSAVDRRDLLGHPTLPREVVPTVSVLTDAFDYLAALPVLLLVVWVDTGRLPATTPLLAVLLVLQGMLVLGVGMAASVADVRWRDARLAVNLVLSVGFFVTPVFYTSRALADERLAALLSWNPMAGLITAQRQVLVDGTLPSGADLLTLTVVCVVVLLFGWTLYRRYSPTFLDHL